MKTIEEIYKLAYDLDGEICKIFCKEVGLRGQTGCAGWTPEEGIINYLNSAKNMMERIYAEKQGTRRDYKRENEIMRKTLADIYEKTKVMLGMSL